MTSAFLFRYNQNFAGLYCDCHRPYPDAEDPVADEMIQCIVCEDWYHGRHLGLEEKPPAHDSYSEMICRNCVMKVEFLRCYQGLSVHTSISLEDTEVDVCKDDEEKECIRKKFEASLNRSEIDDSHKTRTMFMEEGWRKHLCPCDECIKMYKVLNVDFLTDPEDTVHHYEGQSKSGESFLLTLHLHCFL